MKTIKHVWNFWVDFTEFRAIRLCFVDEILYGNSIKERKWWGWKHIPYMEYCNSENIEVSVFKDYDIPEGTDYLLGGKNARNQ